MQRPPRPEPTRISPYFFEQLTPSLPDVDTTELGAEKRKSSTVEAPAANDAAEHRHANTSESAAVASPQRHVDLLSLFSADGPACHRDGAGRPAPVFTAASSPSPATDTRALQRVLWEAFTPAPYTETFATFMQHESAITERLRHIVAEAWESVETLMQRNKDRRSCVAALTDDAAEWRAEVQSKLYWQSDDIVERYGLEVGAPNEKGGAASAETSASPTEKANGTNTAVTDNTHVNGGHGAGSSGSEAEEHVVLDFSVLQDGQIGSALQRRSQEKNASDDDDDVDGDEAPRRGVDGPALKDPPADRLSDPLPKRAKAWTTTTNDLLDPCARPHALRRLFAPLQRARDTLPKWTTLLLKDALVVQQSKLPDLETRLRNSVLFKVPLHRPFIEARAALQACATQQRSAPELEAAQVPAYRQVEQLSKRLSAFLHDQHAEGDKQTAGKDEYGSAAATLSRATADTTANTAMHAAAAPAADKDEILDMGERWATAETLWTMLLHELDACKRFTSDAVPRCASLHDNVDTETRSVQAALQHHRDVCAATLTRMKAEATTCAELLTRNGQRTFAAVQEMEDHFAPDAAHLRTAIARRQKELVQLEAQQEKNLRRVREALKACFVDQIKYEETAQELLQDQLSLAQLEVSHQQLRQAVQVRHEGAIECERHAAQLQELLRDGDEVAHSFFSACDAHMRRIVDEDYYIQCRLVDQCTAVLQQRCRCLHAVAALYDARYAALEDRAGGSWQLQFLLSGERDWAVANLADVRREFTLLEQDWETVRAMRATLEMEAAQLDAMVRTPEWEAWKVTLLALDAPPALQRRLPTLRGHADTLADPAAGRGPQAVRRLLAN